MRSRRIPPLLALLSVLACTSVGARAPGTAAPARAKWTVLVFMNADNNLEQAGIGDFAEMAAVGSTKDVNVVVQFDRIAGKESTTPDWTDTKRFLVRKGMRPLPAAALPQQLGELDMGDPEVLQDFVLWGMAAYPAEHYALIIWDHGQGWRNVGPARAQEDGPPTSQVVGDEFRSSFGTPHRSVSHDDTDHDELYNVETARALAAALGDRKLDLLGFDACLMSMVETAYAMRSTAQVMVASQDLEPGQGWQYDDWLKRLAANPGMSARELGAALVDSYRWRYAEAKPPYIGDPTTTLAAVDLSAMDGVAAATSQLAEVARRHLPTQLEALKAARSACAHFAPNPRDDGRDYFFHVDLVRFSEQLQQRATEQELRDAASAVAASVRAAVIRAFAGGARQGKFGSAGLAIYFPPNQAAYAGDIYAGTGYEKDNIDFPVAFVREQRWADFLHDYLKRVP